MRIVKSMYSSNGNFGTPSDCLPAKYTRQFVMLKVVQATEEHMP